MHMVQSTFQIKKLFLSVYISGIQMVHLHHSISYYLLTYTFEVKSSLELC